MRTLRKTVGARELKTRLGGYLRAVRRGATLVVTERGEPVAELRPIPRGSGDIETRLAELAALGLVTKGSGEPLDAFDPLVIPGPPLSRVIRDERKDRF